MTKLQRLIDWFEPGSAAFVALSGGVDSALVAFAAFEKLGSLATAVTADYKTLSRDEMESSRKVCAEIGIRQVFLGYSELENPGFTKNGSDRCFHCRSELGSYIAGLAGMHGVSTIVDGTNPDDLGEYRPGIAAMRRNGIRSPLVEVGIAKSEVRSLARDAGLSVFDRPSNSCLASRVPWGQRITAEMLTRIEVAETMVKRATDARQVRVRDLGGRARIELEYEVASAMSDSAIRRLKDGLAVIGFSDVEFDRQGYRPGKANVIAD